MLHIAVCDDENAICTQIEQLVTEACRGLEVEADIDIFNSGEGLMRRLDEKNVYHLIFLDIELQHCSGLIVGRHIRDELQDDVTQIVFVSGKSEYDRKLFEFRPFHFIAKPVGQQKILQVIEKYIRIFGNKSDIFNYKYGRDTYWVKISDILYFKSNDRKVLIRTSTGEEEFYGSIERTCEQLKNQGFIMTHKSFLVNYRFIKAFQSEKVVMTNQEEIPIAKSKKKEVCRLQLLLENGGL